MEFKYYYTMEYLPTRYEANDSEWNNRHAVWNFKDGVCSPSIMDFFVEAISQIAGGNKSDYVICFIPASTSAKTNIRFSSLASRLMERTGVNAAMSAITRSSDAEASHIAGKSINPTSDFCFDRTCFKGKKVILIDDVITRGRTFVQTATKLMNMGASSVKGLFVAKTINPDWSKMSA